jgi:hypothetical protein
MDGEWRGKSFRMPWNPQHIPKIRKIGVVRKRTSLTT